MAHLKTEINPKKAGRPRLDPTVVVSVRIPKTLKEKVSARFGKNWMKLFKMFVEVYMKDEFELNSKKQLELIPKKSKIIFLIFFLDFNFVKFKIQDIKSLVFHSEQVKMSSRKGLDIV